MAKTQRRYAHNPCKRHSKRGCDYGVTGECKRPYRRLMRRIGKAITRQAASDD